MTANCFSADPNFKKLTIVVPTLGKNISSSWISSILKLASLSVHIFIILPPNHTKSSSVPSFDCLNSNISFFLSPCKGQVAQRIYGFSLVRTEFVLQLDDDVIIEPKTLLSLLHLLSLSESSLAISPLIKNELLASSSNSLNPLISLRNAFLYWTFNPRSGTISKSGFPVPFSVNQCSSLQAVSWLPGCCVLHRTKDTYQFNYFPFLGKAYCEDLIHSFNLLINGVSLAVATDLYIDTPIASFVELSFKDFAKYIISDYRIRLYYVRITSSNPNLMRISYLYIVASYGFRTILKLCVATFLKVFIN